MAPNMFAAWTRAKWIGQGRGWIDPLKEAQGARELLGMGLSTMELLAAEQGHDWMDLADQSETERKYYHGMGREYPGDIAAKNPRAVMGANGGPPLHDDDENPEH